ncbi:FUSC family protein [Nonomuraea sediminis]|uniref:FUSC family protein n=1 Tax=Nonomuraea sediminis TaxID=2835864 RepID=UPI001BDBE47E|nr:FUSC family protein [Nonomuraea sediminis]
MRGAALALRRGFSLPARPPWGYGLLCAVAIASPLLLGALTRQPLMGVFVALGAYFTAFGDLYGKPYGTRARALVVKLVLIAAGCWLGLLVAPWPWVGVAVVGLVAAAGGQWRLVGMPPVLATVVGFYAGLPASPGPPLQMALGGLVFCLLALALWPFRRLDPLKDALNEAVEAVGGMLEGLALPEDEWVERREHGSKALDAAETASAAFHSTDDRTRSADAFVQTLVRIFHESVALRVLRAEAVQDQAEIDKVVSALSAALRDPTRVRAALTQTAAFAEWISGLRARQRADPASLRRIAVLGQVRRCLDRIAVAVRTVGLLATDGVRAPARLPRFSWKLGAEEPEHAGRLGIAAAVAMALMVGFHEHYGKWFVFTVMLALRSTYGDTVDRVVLRVAGTMVGASVAAVILAVVPGPYTIVGTVLVFATLGFALRQVSYAYWSVFATPLAMLLADFGTRLDWKAAAVRLALTVAGGALALVAARVLWPRGEKSKIHGLIVDLLREHGVLVRALAERELDRVPELTETAGQAADRLSESLDRLEKEPGGSAPPDLREAVTLARQVRDDAILVSAVLRGSEIGLDATAAVLDAVADRLATVAQAVRDDKEPPEADELEAGLSELAGEVTSLMEVAAAGEPSAVRRQLRHAVTVRPALKSLSKDALALAQAVTR